MHLFQEKVRALIADMLRSDFENRPTFREILSFPILKSEYISIVHFLQSITLKSRSEKEHFFRWVLMRRQRIPRLLLLRCTNRGLKLFGWSCKNL